MIPLIAFLLQPAQLAPIPPPDFPREVQAAALAATVRITDPERQASASGVILGRNGPTVYILTARHAVEGADRLEVSTFTDGSPPRPRTVFRTAKVEALAEGPADLALVRLTTTEEMPGVLRLCPLRLIPNGERFTGLSVGCDGGLAPKSQTDVVVGAKRVRRQAQGPAALFWEIERLQAQGRSGGPLVDKRGYLLGIGSGTSREKSYYCHVEEVRAFLKKQGLRWLIEQE